MFKKTNKSKECMICHYWYFVDNNYKYEGEVCNECHDKSMMAYEFKTIAIMNVKGIDYRCLILNMTRNDAIDRLNNSEIDAKESWWIWTVVQIKHQ